MTDMRVEDASAYTFPSMHTAAQALLAKLVSV
jgi:hypothetical protein